MLKKPYWFSIFNSSEKEFSSGVIIADSKDEADAIVNDFITVNELYEARGYIIKEFTLDFINQTVEDNGVLLYEEIEDEEEDNSEGFKGRFFN